jgi:RNA-directed DNA polymerase
MDELKASGKPFRITKQEVWDAWLKVKDIPGA